MLALLHLVCPELRLLFTVITRLLYMFFLLENVNLPILYNRVG
jgi:hypothetical protein